MSDSNSTKNRKQRQRDPRNIPPKFTVNVSIPALLCVQQGKLKMAEAFLLSMMDEYARADNQGCWAGNPLLAMRCNLKRRQLQYMIAKLRDKGFLRYHDTPMILRGEEVRTFVVDFDAQD